jgi:hypothetical protein
VIARELKMGTDWGKVIEVFFSGIIGVFVVMLLLQILTQLSTRVIDAVEARSNDSETDKTAGPVRDE